MNEIIRRENSVEKRLTQLGRLVCWPDEQIGEKGNASSCYSSGKREDLSILLCKLQGPGFKDVVQIRWSLAWCGWRRVIKHLVLIKYFVELSEVCLACWPKNQHVIAPLLIGGSCHYAHGFAD